MTLARKNPLAPGVYWLDVFRPFGDSKAPDQDPTMREWLEANETSVHVLRRELGDVITSETKDGASLDRLHLFYLFEVTGQPSPFPFTALGYPTIQKLARNGITDADRNVAKDDTAKAPQPEGFKLPDLGANGPLLLLAAMLILSYAGSRPTPRQRRLRARLEF